MRTWARHWAPYPVTPIWQWFPQLCFGWPLLAARSSEHVVREPHDKITHTSLNTRTLLITILATSAVAGLRGAARLVGTIFIGRSHLTPLPVLLQVGQEPINSYSYIHTQCTYPRWPLSHRLVGIPSQTGHAVASMYMAYHSIVQQISLSMSRVTARKAAAVVNRAKNMLSMTVGRIGDFGCWHVLSLLVESANLPTLPPLPERTSIKVFTSQPYS